ncbi:MAG: hypothetical protein KME29_09015 [Calothrix sp. FI2-JRJ7]|jgi:hypothetical protein|nr:hypothetical protein [Calothrix sp. FI2-JRJ7]
MVARKGRTGNPGQKNPLKKNATTFKVEEGKEPRSEQPMCFRPTVSLLAEINAAIAESGLAKAQWLEAAVIAYLRQNSSVTDVLSEE